MTRNLFFTDVNHNANASNVSGKLNDIRAQIREMKSMRLLSTTLDAPIPSTCLAMCCMPIMLPSNGSTVRIPTILCCMFFFASIHQMEEQRVTSTTGLN